MFDNIKIGDHLKRMYPHHNTELEYSAEVVAIDANVITCLVNVDVPRRMKFSRKTGVSLLGSEYGRLTQD